MKIGVRAHDYGKMEIEKLAKTLHEEGYVAAQLALPKAFAGIDSYDDITLSHLEQIRTAFEKYGVEIPVFGCYMDLGNPDDEIRSKAVKTICTCLSYSKEIGAKVLGTETAYPRLSGEEKKLWRPYMMDSIQRVMEEAVRLDVKFAIEPVYWHPLDSLEIVQEVIDKIDDAQHLRLIFDASNLLEFPDKTEQNDYWKEWLENIGSYVDVMHIKDFSLDEKRQYQPELLGEGVIDYTYISQWLHDHAPDMYLLREEMNPKTAQLDIAYLRKF